MNEGRRTALMVAAAVFLALTAWWTRPGPMQVEVMADRGASFFPEFTDPNGATALEVVEFDPAISAARPFKLLNRDGRWTIPSRYDYPADHRDRLSSIAAAVIALRRDDVAGDNAGDHEPYGVVDPLDVTVPGNTGRGTRLTVRGRNDRVLADVIAGKPVADRPQFRYVRLPGDRRTYIARVEGLEISTRFEDWIERNLLLVDRTEIDQILVRNYSADAKTGRVDQRDTLAFRSTGRDQWEAAGIRPGEALDPFAMNLLVTKLVELTIVDVQPKPEGISASLGRTDGAARLTPADIGELAGRGFYFAQDGRLLSNQGEVLVHTTDGIFYILRFGEVASGTLPENRYLFISVGFDPGTKASTEAVQARLDVLRARFAPWYYVVSDDNFRKIRLSRADVIKPASAVKRDPGQP
jgi:hypothetical protein